MNNDKNPITISINFDYSEYKTDFIFLSNLRRFREFNKIKNCKCIVTSNIPVDDVYCKVDYVELRNSIEYVEDNAGLMCIKMLINMGFDEIYDTNFGADLTVIEEAKEFADDNTDATITLTNAMFSNIPFGSIV